MKAIPTSSKTKEEATSAEEENSVPLRSTHRGSWRPSDLSSEVGHGEEGRRPESFTLPHLTTKAEAKADLSREKTLLLGL